MLSNPQKLQRLHQYQIDLSPESSIPAKYIVPDLFDGTYCKMVSTDKAVSLSIHHLDYIYSLSNNSNGSQSASAKLAMQNLYRQQLDDFLS